MVNKLERITLPSGKMSDKTQSFTAYFVPMPSAWSSGEAPSKIKWDETRRRARLPVNT